jgi:hypothetical protein
MLFRGSDAIFASPLIFLLFEKLKFEKATVFEFNAKGFIYLSIYLFIFITSLLIYFHTYNIKYKQFYWTVKL